MKIKLSSRVLYTGVILGLLGVSFSTAEQKPKGSALQTVQNKTCGFWLRYPKLSQLDHPSDCVLKITPPASYWPQWVADASLTLYTAPVSQSQMGETPAGEPNPEQPTPIKAGGMTFTKTVYEDSAMSHHMITVVYEGEGKYRKYRFEAFLNAANPETMDLHVDNWDPEKFTEEKFDELVSTFRPMK
jgi:hypothetical protein